MPAVGDNLKEAVHAYEKIHIENVLRRIGHDKRKPRSCSVWGCPRSIGRSKNCTSRSATERVDEPRPAVASVRGWRRHRHRLEIRALHGQSGEPEAAESLDSLSAHVLASEVEVASDGGTCLSHDRHGLTSQYADTVGRCLSLLGIGIYPSCRKSASHKGRHTTCGLNPLFVNGRTRRAMECGRTASRLKVFF